MARTLNSAGMAFARACISAGRVSDAAWSFDASDGNALLGQGGDDWTNYGKHFLAVNGDASEGTKDRYSYPFAKGDTLYKSALRAIRSRASQQGDTAIFAVCHRPVQGARGVYRVNLRHGVSRVRTGRRHTAGIIFHDAA